MCSIARTWMAVPVDHYVDDYVEPDVAAGGASAQESVEVSHNVLGHSTEARKRKPHAPQHPILGVGVSLADIATRLRVTAFAIPMRVLRTMAAFTEMRERQRMSPREASQTHGRISYLL